MHRIGADACQSRQGANFHKCHRCVYRGKPAEWSPEEPAHLTIELEPRKPAKNGTPRPARKTAPVEKKPVEKKPVEKKPVEKAPAENAPVEIPAEPARAVKARRQRARKVAGTEIPGRG